MVMKGNTPTLMQSEERRAPWNDDVSTPTHINVNVECVMCKKNIGIETFTDDEKQAYLDSKEYTILEMLEVLRKFVIREMPMRPKNSPRGKSLRNLLKSINGWEQVELNVERNG